MCPIAFLPACAPWTGRDKEVDWPKCKTATKYVPLADQESPVYRHLHNSSSGAATFSILIPDLSKIFSVAKFFLFLTTFAGYGVALAEEESQRAPANRSVSSEKSLDQVIVTGRRSSDTEERRYSTAAKMVFGREELDRYGDDSIGEVLKRLPGITVSGTPGRSGDIRMRGLGKGYTLILLNGEPAPRGFSMDSLAPDQVERIEVMRAPVAENSARAIAGTINIVLREDFVKRENQGTAALGREAGRLQPGFSLQRSDTVGTLNYNLSASLFHKDLPNQSRTDTTAVNLSSGMPVLVQSQQDRSDSVSDRMHLNARLSWRLGGGDTFSFLPFMTQSRIDTIGTTKLEQTTGTAPPPFSRADWHTHSDSMMTRGMGNLKLNLNDGAKLEIRFSGRRSSSDTQSAHLQFDPLGVRAHTIQSNTEIDDNGFSTSGKFSRPLMQEHQVAAGWELESGNRTESAVTLQDGFNPLTRYGDNIQAQTRRVAVYVQDEWDISPLWSVYGGLRWEGIRTFSETALDSAQNQSKVLSPLFHSVWRFSKESKDQVRLGLTRSYRSPTLANLVAVPTLTTNYAATGVNTVTSPDSVGNPNLKPELAWGLDIAYEHYFSAGGLLSASIFRRSIEDLIRNITSLQTVSWSPQQRWLSTPQNIGRASTRGVELEAKFRLDALMVDAPKLNLRANYSRFWSNVENVPGPNNRLDQQPRQTVNLGIDYRLRVLPLTLGGNINWTPAFVVQQTEAQLYYQGVKRAFDVYALWKFDPNIQLRVSASNLLHADYETANREIFSGTDQKAETVKKTFPALVARLEIKF